MNKQSKKIFFILSVFFTVELFCVSAANAAMLPMIRFSAPEKVNDGEMFEAKVCVLLPTNLSYSALTVSFLWDTKKLKAIGGPEINPEIYSKNGEKLFDIILAAQCNSNKGLAEIALGRWKDSTVFAIAGEQTVLTQRFKAIGGSGYTKIEFTTASDVTNNGTACYVGKKEIEFKLFKTALIQIN